MPSSSNRNSDPMQNGNGDDNIANGYHRTNTAGRNRENGRFIGLGRVIQRNHNPRVAVNVFSRMRRIQQALHNITRTYAALRMELTALNRAIRIQELRMREGRLNVSLGGDETRIEYVVPISLQNNYQDRSNENVEHLEENGGNSDTDGSVSVEYGDQNQPYESGNE